MVSIGHYTQNKTISEKEGIKINPKNEWKVLNALFFMRFFMNSFSFITGSHTPSHRGRTVYSCVIPNYRIKQTYSRVKRKQLLFCCSCNIVDKNITMYCFCYANQLLLGSNRHVLSSNRAMINKRCPSFFVIHNVIDQ